MTTADFARIDRSRVTVSETGFDAITLSRRARVFRDNESGWTDVLPWLKNHVEARR